MQNSSQIIFFCVLWKCRHLNYYECFARFLIVFFLEIINFSHMYAIYEFQCFRKNLFYLTVIQCMQVGDLLANPRLIELKYVEYFVQIS